MPARSDPPVFVANLSTPIGAPAPGPTALTRWALIALAAFAALFRETGGQYWFRLAAGRSILAHGFPATETWTLAARGQAPWLPEWLYNVALFLTHALGGEPATAVWRMAWAGAVMALGLAVADAIGAWSFSAVLIAPLAVAISRDRFQARPETVLLALVLCVVLRFEQARRGPKDGTRWLVLGQALWTNLHGSWVLGPLLAWIYALGEAWPARRFARAGAWALLGLVLAAASAIFPRPLDALAHPLRFLTDNGPDPVSGVFTELRSWTWPDDLLTPFSAFAALWLIGAALGGRRVWRASPALALASIGAMALGFLFLRFRALAAWVSLAPLALALEPATRGWLGRLRRVPALAAAGVAVWWLAVTPGFAPGLGTLEDQAPAAVALADSAGLSGLTLNSARLGGYLLWKRGDAHPPLTDYRARGSLPFRSLYAGAHTDPLALDSLLDAWRFSHALIVYPRGTDNLATNLSERLEWALVHYDDDACLYVRWSDEPDLAHARAYRYLTPNELTMSEMAVNALTDSGLARRLGDELQLALARSPRHARTAFWLATLALNRNDGAAAVRFLAEAERIDPHLPGLSIHFGLAYDLIGDRRRAVLAYRRALREPEDAEEAKAILEAMQGQ